MEAEQAVRDEFADRDIASSSAFSFPGYRLLWVGTLASFAPNPLRFSAGVLFLTNSAPDDVRLLLAGVLGAISGGVTLLFGMVGGALADRFNRRRLLMAAQLVLIAATLGVALAMTMDVGALSLALFFTFIFVGAAAMSVDLPTRQALVTEVVPRERLSSAVALDSVAMWISLPIGLPLAGILIDGLGYAGAYACAAAGYAVAFLALVPLKSREAKPAPIASRLSLLSDMREGVAYVRRHDAIFWTLGLFFVVMALGFPLVASFGPVWVTEVLGLSASEFGFFAATWALGAIAASLSMARVGHFPAKGWLFLGAAVLFAVLVVAWAYSRSVAFSACLNFGLGASITVAQISSRSLIQRAVPFELQGRVMSLLMLNFAVANIALFVGGLAQLTSLELVTAALGWTTLFLVLLIVMTRPAIRRIGEMSPP